MECLSLGPVQFFNHDLNTAPIFYGCSMKNKSCTTQGSDQQRQGEVMCLRVCMSLSMCMQACWLECEMVTPTFSDTCCWHGVSEGWPRVNAALRPKQPSQPCSLGKEKLITSSFSSPVPTSVTRCTCFLQKSWPGTLSPDMLLLFARCKWVVFVLFLTGYGVD